MRSANNKRPPDGNKKRDLNPFADLELRSLRDYMMIIRERWILAVSCALLASCLVGYALLSRPVIYQAEAALLIDRQGERVVDMQQVVDTGLEGSGQMWVALLENHIQQLTSRNFRNYVATSLTEQETKGFLAPYLSEDPEKEPPTVGSILEENVTVENLQKSFVLQVNIRHRSAEAAALIADRYVERYIRFNMDRSQTGNSAAVGFLTEQAEELRAQVEEAERALQEYRQKHNLVSVEENQSIIVQRLKDISGSLTSARNMRLDQEGRLRQVDNFRNDGKNLLELSDIASFGSTPELVSELDKLRKEREVMSEKYAHLHPRIIAISRSISTVEGQIRENNLMAVAELRTRLRNAEVKEAALLDELRKAEQESLDLDKLTIEYEVLRRAAEVARSTHAQIITRLNETSITSQLENTNIRIIDRAAVPIRPVEPNLKKVALLVIFLGGFFFVGVPLGLEFFDNKLKTSWDVEHFLSQRLVGLIPSVAKMEERERTHILEKDLSDNVVEAFRGILSQLEVISEVDYPKSMVVTSTVPAEGKSFVCANLGACFASHGRKTLLVDCDFRRPVMHRAYDLDNQHGILKWMESGKIELEEESLGIVEVAPNLFLLRAGGHTKKATEVISNPKVEALFKELRKQFDMILVDAPPVGVFPDALSLAGFTDEALYVARFGKVDRQQAKNFINRMTETDAVLAGIVLNVMPPGKVSSYGYYGNYKYQNYYANQA